MKRRGMISGIKAVNNEIMAKRDYGFNIKYDETPADYF